MAAVMDISYVCSLGLPVHVPAKTSKALLAEALQVAKPVQSLETTQDVGVAGQVDPPLQSSAAASKPLYMDATYVFQCQSSIEHSKLSEDGQALLVQLNQTVFHPQGGGQPTDIGRLLADGVPPLDVVFVSKDKVDQSTIWHECRGDVQHWLGKKGLEVTCVVDDARRRLCARLHSAGHLLDVAMMAAGFRWKPGKGYHFPDGPYVEYLPSEEGRQVDLKDTKAKELVLQELASKMKELIDRNVPTGIGYVDGTRTITMDGVACGCGGTHVEFSGEIGEVTIKKIQSKQGNIRVSYALA
ncbi:alaS [Symbiodinium natans]|uniref:AlaS protein n=1 Tax=Symbiodinium natans TaxID=878477 RepID=A0A812THS3_9DINO|nr:alaS [Symbiodinium natans]